VTEEHPENRPTKDDDERADAIIHQSSAPPPGSAPGDATKPPLAPTAGQEHLFDDWLLRAWHALTDRFREVLTRRQEGETLESIGRDLGLSRERVRQVQRKAQVALLAAQQQAEPHLATAVHNAVGDAPAVPDDRILSLVVSQAPAAAVLALLECLDVRHPTTWAGDLVGYWTRDATRLNALLNRMVALAPMTQEEAEQASCDLGIADVPWSTLLDHPKSKITYHELGWIRRARSSRDVAYLWLREQGEPCTASEIAKVTGTNEHAIRETMRRDDDFAQVRPEGTWALADWRVQGSDNRYTSAVDVVVEVLRELGPQDFEHLRAESQRRYPVSAWRITQCLSSNLIGLNDAGLYDLTERGANPIEDSEPKKPRHMEAHGNVVGIELTVDSDLLRGSGIPVHRWLTWHLGLRTAPSARYFDLLDGQGTITVKRATSNSQISSLRALAQHEGLVAGCKLTVLLRTDVDTASYRHTCRPASCPAHSQT
jgi:hypothetical protein